jgi:pyridoxamine 5'-phosphate oxidase
VDEHELDPDPLAQFAAWFEAARAERVPAVEAGALGTATPDGAPSVRFVLLKGYDERGFVFYTGYESRKGHELEANPRAALTLYWQPLGRQVRLEGTVERVSEAESQAYFASRPLGSRLGAWASRQSEPIGSRAELDELLRDATARFADGEVPLPDAWGGYRLAPESYEFWEHQDDRLHDRVLYVPDGAGGWRKERLQP